MRKPNTVHYRGIEIHVSQEPRLNAVLAGEPLVEYHAVDPKDGYIVGTATNRVGIERLIDTYLRNGRPGGPRRRQR